MWWMDNCEVSGHPKEVGGAPACNGKGGTTSYSRHEGPVSWQELQGGSEDSCDVSSAFPRVPKRSWSRRFPWASRSREWRCSSPNRRWDRGKSHRTDGTTRPRNQLRSQNGRAHASDPHALAFWSPARTRSRVKCLQGERDWGSPLSERHVSWEHGEE